MLAPWHIIVKFFLRVWDFFCPFFCVTLFYTIFEDYLAVYHCEKMEFKKIQTIFGSIIVNYDEISILIENKLSENNLPKGKEIHLMFLKTFLDYIKFVSFFFIFFHIKYYLLILKIGLFNVALFGK